MASADIGTTPVVVKTTASGVLNIYNEGPSVVYFDMGPDVTSDSAMGVIEIGDTYTSSTGFSWGAERWLVCKTGTAKVRWGMER